MKVSVYLEKAHGNHAFVYYVGQYSVLYEMTYTEGLDSFLSNVKLGLDNSKLLCMEREAFEKRYTFVFKATIEKNKE